MLKDQASEHKSEREVGSVPESRRESRRVQESGGESYRHSSRLAALVEVLVLLQEGDNRFKTNRGLPTSCLRFVRSCREIDRVIVEGMSIVCCGLLNLCRDIARVLYRLGIAVNTHCLRPRPLRKRLCTHAKTHIHASAFAGAHSHIHVH